MTDAKLRYKPTRRRFLRDSTLTTIGLMVAACAPGTTGPTGGGTAKKGGEFHGGWPYVLPPAGHWNGYAPNGILTTGIYRHLWLTTLGMYLWADKKFEYWLAESSGYKGENYELKLRSGIKWSDGTPFTAKDVYTTFNVGRLDNFTIWNYIDRMDIVNDQTINFHFTRQSSLAERLLLREPTRPDALYGTYSKKLDDLVKAGKKSTDQEWKDLRTEKDAFRPKEPTSVGPYKIDPATLTESQVTFVKNPGGYAADRVNFDKVVVYQGETNQISPLVLSGDVDYARCRQGHAGRRHPHRAPAAVHRPGALLPLGEGARVPGRAAALRGRARDQQGGVGGHHLRRLWQSAEVHGRLQRPARARLDRVR